MALTLPRRIRYVMHSKFVKNYRREWGKIDPSYMRRSGLKAWVNDQQTHKSKTTASTISAGLTVPEIGFTASAQTGWSNTDTLFDQNTQKGHGYVCAV